MYGFAVPPICRLGIVWSVIGWPFIVMACQGNLRGSGDDDGSAPHPDENVMLVLQTGSYPTGGPFDVELTGGVREPFDVQTGQRTSDWTPAYSAVVHTGPVVLPYVGPDHLEECWSYIFIADDLSDRFGSTLALRIGSNDIIMEDIGGGLYLASTEGAVAESIEQEGGALSFGGSTPGIAMPEPFDLDDRVATWSEMADSGLLALSWTPGTGGPNTFVQATGLGNEQADLEDEVNFVCALSDDGHAVIDLGRPRPDIVLTVGRVQAIPFESDYGSVLGWLYDSDVFITPK